MCIEITTTYISADLQAYQHIHAPSIIVLSCLRLLVIQDNIGFQDDLMLVNLSCVPAVSVLLS